MAIPLFKKQHLRAGLLTFALFFVFFAYTHLNLNPSDEGGEASFLHVLSSSPPHAHLTYAASDANATSDFVQNGGDRPFLETSANLPLSDEAVWDGSSSISSPAPPSNHQSISELLAPSTNRHSLCDHSVPWIESVHQRKWVYTLYPDVTEDATPQFVPQTELEALVSIFCDSQWLMNSTGKVWRVDGGGPETDPKYENYNSGMVDDPKCSVTMGHSSRPIGDNEFQRSKFLAVYYLPEQSTKAIRHLRAAMCYARRTRRILILPRVGSKTRAGSVSMGGYLPLCAYFEIPKMGGFDWVSYEYYHSTSTRLNLVPDVGFMCHLKPNEERFPFDYDSKLSPLRLLPLIVLTRGKDPNANNTRKYDCPPGSKCIIRSNTGDGPSKAENDMWKKKNLVVLIKTISSINVYDVPLKIPLANYSSRILQRAKEISNLLGRPYISIHLRLEHLTYHKFSFEKVNDRFMKCVGGLISYVTEYLSNFPDPTKPRLYLASDISDFSVQSSSWLPEYINSSLRAFHHLKQNLNFSMFEDFEPEYGKLDHGIHGIIDKLVCASADTFFAAEKVCGGLRSFDSDILRLREQAGKRKETVVYWKL